MSASRSVGLDRRLVHITMESSVLSGGVIFGPMLDTMVMKICPCASCCIWSSEGLTKGANIMYAPNVMKLTRRPQMSCALPPRPGNAAGTPTSMTLRKESKISNPAQTRLDRASSG